jgi:hypothetical protein
MSEATVVRIGDRIYAINQTLSDVQAARYWPTNFITSARWPLLIPIPEQRIMVPTSDRRRVSTRTWSIWAVLGAFTQAIPAESVQKLGETLLDTIYDLYDGLPHLELGGAALDGVRFAQLTGDSGIVHFPDDPSLASISFTLAVTSYSARQFHGA